MVLVQREAVEAFVRGEHHLLDRIAIDARVVLGGRGLVPRRIDPDRVMLLVEVAGELAVPHRVHERELHVRAPSAAASVRGARSRSGHQWFTQPSSSKSGRTRGITVSAKPARLSRASSFGVEPICMQTIRWPQRYFVTSSST